MDVLVIDDDDAYRELVVGALRQCTGAAIHDFPEGGQALAHLGRPSGQALLVVVDLHMPRMPGSEVISRVRALRPGATVAAMSSVVGDLERDAGLAAGAAIVLQKPMHMAGILTAMRALLHLARNAGGRPSRGDAP
jgi:two-component system, OmpR family, response regulator